VTFELALFGDHTRLLVGLAAVVCAVAALVLARLSRSAVRHPGLEAAGVAATASAVILIAALGAERLVALALAGAAPEGVSFNEVRWVVGAPWGRAGIAAGVAITAATLVLGAIGTRRERLARRALLVSLRAGACGAALVLFLEPALELRHVTREPNHVAILVDDSRSMELAEQKDGPTRAARAAGLIASSAAVLERWREQHVLDFYTFSDSLLPSSEGQAVVPAPGRGDATLVREALESLRNRYDRRDLAGVVILSDGTPTGRFADGVSDGVAQDFLQGLGVRVHAVWTGAHGLADVAVARVIADDFAFVRTAVKIEAVIRATGLGERELPVTLRRDGEPVTEIVARVGGRAGDSRVVFEIVPERVGKYVYEISVPVLAEEAVPANNSRAFVMRVTRDKTRVLQVAGRPSWDERALRAYFKADPNVDLISFFILRTHDDIQIVPTEELSLIPFPTQELFEEELGSFDVIILQNFELANYGIRPYLTNILQYVANGGGLAMIGGDLGFSSGGYHGTPVADALPVELLPPYGGPDRLVSATPFAPRLTDEGVRHPVTQLRFERRDNLARWASLPQLEGQNLVAGVRPGATVLLEHPTLRLGGRAMPLLVAGEHEKGRTLALLTDSAWRWGFVAAGRDGDDGRAYAKLMDNVVRWLIKDPELDYLRVESDQAEYKKGQPARFRARLTDKDYQPAPAHEVIFDVVPARAPKRAEKLEPIVSRTVKTDDAGAAAAEVATLSPGSYRVVARARLGDRWVTADDVFVMNPEREELAHPEAREDVLAGLAAATGGRYLGAATALAGDLEFEPPRVVRVDRRSDIEIWSRPHLYALALLFLGAEWALRRRRGFL
jgi:uncharacterized membrane protein